MPPGISDNEVGRSDWIDGVLHERQSPAGRRGGAPALDAVRRRQRPHSERQRDMRDVRQDDRTVLRP